MLRTQNKYCSNCLETRRFLDLGACLVCERCSKRLERIDRAPKVVEGRLVAWIERAETRREAV